MNRATQAVLFSSDKIDWETPQSLFDELDKHHHSTKWTGISPQRKTDCRRTWEGETVFCNPPYGNKETGLWTKKCFEEAQKPGTTVVLLIPARTDRASFHEYIYNKLGVSVRFLRGRLTFEVDGELMRDKKGSIANAPFPSMIVEFKCT